MKNQTPTILKLANGENIIGFVSEDNNHLIIDYPLSMKIVFQAGKNGPESPVKSGKTVKSTKQSPKRSKKKATNHQTPARK